MEMSILLAKMIGLYCLIISISALLNYQRLSILVNNILRNEGLHFITAIIALILGILVTTFHPALTNDWRLIITLFGWTAFLIGMINLLIPDLAKQLLEALSNHPLLFALINLCVLGCSLILLNEGFGIAFRFS